VSDHYATTAAAAQPKMATFGDVVLAGIKNLGWPLAFLDQSTGSFCFL